MRSKPFRIHEDKKPLLMVENLIFKRNHLQEEVLDVQITYPGYETCYYFFFNQLERLIYISLSRTTDDKSVILTSSKSWSLTM